MSKPVVYRDKVLEKQRAMSSELSGFVVGGNKFEVGIEPTTTRIFLASGGMLVALDSIHLSP